MYFGFFEDIFYSSFFCLLFYHTCPLFYYISKDRLDPKRLRRYNKYERQDV
nr:MAG TPA: hypothetical protein [Caudoviricetes sp.]